MAAKMLEMHVSTGDDWEKLSDPIYLLKTAGEMAEWLKAAVC